MFEIEQAFEWYATITLSKQTMEIFERLDWRWRDVALLFQNPGLFEDPTLKENGYCKTQVNYTIPPTEWFSI